MRYFFESKVEKKDVGYTIQIPFNVWEVCHQREVIKGDIVLDNNIIQCELHPKEKGNYEIVITDEDILLRVDKMDKNRIEKIYIKKPEPKEEA